MQLKIMYADVTDPRVQEFLQAHLDDIAPTAPEESRHALSLAELADPSVRLWAVRDGDEVVGTGALAALEPEHEELKSMRTVRFLRRGSQQHVHDPRAVSARLKLSGVLVALATKTPDS